MLTVICSHINTPPPSSIDHHVHQQNKRPLTCSLVYKDNVAINKK